jgi:hypothetical protein
MKDNFFSEIYTHKENPEKVKEVFDFANFRQFEIDPVLDFYRPNYGKEQTVRNGIPELPNTAEKYETSTTNSTFCSENLEKKIDLAKLRLNYMAETPSRISVNHLDMFSGDVLPFIEQIIIENFFAGKSESLTEFLNEESVNLHKYRNACLNKCPYESEIGQYRSMDEESIFQPFFTVYLYQLKKRLEKFGMNPNAFGIMKANGMDLNTSIHLDVTNKSKTIAKTMANVHLKGHPDIVISNPRSGDCGELDTMMKQAKITPAKTVNRKKGSGRKTVDSEKAENPSAIEHDPNFYYKNCTVMPNPSLLSCLSILELKPCLNHLFQAAGNNAKDKTIGQALCAGNMKRFYNNSHEISIKVGLTDLFGIFVGLRFDFPPENNTIRSLYFMSDSVTEGSNYLKVLLFLLCDINYGTMKKLVQILSSDGTTKASVTVLPHFSDDDADDSNSSQEKETDNGNKDPQKHHPRENNQRNQNNDNETKKTDDLQDCEASNGYDDFIGEVSIVVEDYDVEIMKCRKENEERIAMQGLNKENVENTIFPSSGQISQRRQVVDNCHANGFAYLSPDELNKNVFVKHQIYNPFQL